MKVRDCRPVRSPTHRRGRRHWDPWRNGDDPKSSWT